MLDADVNAGPHVKRCDQSHRRCFNTASMGRRTVQRAFRPDLRCHEPFWSWPKPHEQELAGAQFSETKTAQRFHVDKNVRCPLAAREETEATETIEPLDLSA